LKVRCLRGVLNHPSSATLTTWSKTRNAHFNYDHSVERVLLRSEIPKPVDSRHLGARALCCECRVTLIRRSVGTMRQFFSPVSAQNCKSQPQARNPTTGQYYPFCSKTCAASKPLPGLPTGPNVGGGPSTSTGTNTRTMQALSLCTVSVCVPSVVGKFLNNLCSQALQKKTEVQ
jgi:hypothetical protein